MAKAIRYLIAGLIFAIIAVMFVTGRFSWQELKYQARRYFYMGRAAAEEATSVTTIKGSREKAAQCRENLKQIERAKRRVADEAGMTTGLVTVQQVQSALGGRIPTCPSGGTYFINPLVQLPTCSIGAGPNALTKQDDHLIIAY